MPDCGTDAFTILDQDGNHNVYINNRLSYDGQIEAFKHELKHIKNGDFERFDVQQIEFDVRR